jgi:HK97 family phage major capsid protein
MNEMQKLQARLAELRARVEALRNAASAAGRDLSEDEEIEIDGALDEIEVANGKVARFERLENLAAANASGGNRRSAPSAPGGGLEASGRPGSIQAPVQSQQDRNKWGWRGLGEFAAAVRNASVGASVDPRLMNAPTTYGQEAVGADGGFAVPPDWRNNVTSLIMGESSMISMCDAIPTASNSVTAPVDEDSAWSASGGIRVFMRAEAGTMTASKPALKEITVKLNELYAFVPVTDELLEDAPLLENLLTTKAAEKLNFRINDLILNGTGAGQPLGIMNSPSRVTVSKESSQAAATVLAANVVKMYARMPAFARSRAVWLINQDVEPQIHQLGLTISNPAGSQLYGGAPMFIPPGGMTSAPSGTLLGRPIVPTEACQTLGTAGDIILADLQSYFLPYKSAGIRSDVSMHLYFDSGHTAFRWTFRFGGQPWLSAPIGRKNGTNTLSHFVALETR